MGESGEKLRRETWISAVSDPVSGGEWAERGKVQERKSKTVEDRGLSGSVR